MRSIILYKISPQLILVVYRFTHKIGDKILIDEYRRGWALRCIREAEAELEAAKTSPDMALTLILEALRKAQAAIYYSLGEPASIERVVHQILRGRTPINDPVLKCLVEIESSIQQIARGSTSIIDEAMEIADEVIKIASRIVDLFIDDN